MNKQLNNPFYLSTFDLPRQPGASKDIKLELPLDELVGTQLQYIEKGQKVSFEVTLDSVLEGIYLIGKAETNLKTICSRCAKEFNEDISVNLNGFYPYEESALDFDESLDVYNMVENQYIDLIEILRDSVSDQIEFSPLCSDCKEIVENHEEGDPELSWTYSENGINDEKDQVDDRFFNLLKLKEQLAGND
ncbi:MAG: DUF177 domain-containing protein [Candidatus Ancillula sp.]|nr:DUF177 domain-containing protein [Candidatus Ancillula sp.]